MVGYGGRYCWSDTVRGATERAIMRRMVIGSGWRRKRGSAERAGLQRCRVHEGVHDYVQQKHNRQPGFRPLHTLLQFGVWRLPNSNFRDCAHMGSCSVGQPDRCRDVAQCSTICGNSGFDCRQQTNALIEIEVGVRYEELVLRNGLVSIAAVHKRTRNRVAK